MDRTRSPLWCSGARGGGCDPPSAAGATNALEVDDGRRRVAAVARSAEAAENRAAAGVPDAGKVKAVAAQLAEAQARLCRTRIAAPVQGTVLTRNAEPGQIANPGGEVLFRVASGGKDEMRGK